MTNLGPDRQTMLAQAVVLKSADGLVELRAIPRFIRAEGQLADELRSYWKWLSQERKLAKERGRPLSGPGIHWAGVNHWRVYFRTQKPDADNEWNRHMENILMSYAVKQCDDELVLLAYDEEA